MSYISNNSRIASVTISGTDYTSNFVEWTVSDSTANKQGCIQTSGTLILGTQAGGSSLEDYDRNRFRRGEPVVLRVTQPGGGDVVHPRGLLYVISNSYDAESETLTIEIACRLSLLALTEDSEEGNLDQLVNLAPLALDTAQSTYSNCCAAFASVGQYVYQDNNGSLQTGEFWSGDNTSGTAAGEWVSVLGTTTNSVQPLAGTGAIPDEIKLSYSVPAEDIASDQKGRVDTNTTDSYYFLQYPVVSFQRQNTDATTENPNGTLDNIDSTATEEPATASSSSCGNSPEPPEGVEEPPSCNEGYTLVQSPVFLPAFRRETSVTKYDGPGAQVSSVKRTVRGPRIESNQQYFADNFAFCRQTWGTACQPDGNCPYDGMDEIELGYTEQINYFGSANEIVKSITDTYETLLSAAQPSDWRAGNVSGEIQDFDSSYLTNAALYRSQRVETTYKQEDNVNVQETLTYTSLTSRGVGIKGGQDIDAVTGGIKTLQIRKSATTTTLDITPDILNSPKTNTEEKSLTIPLFTGRFVTPPAEAGPYVMEEQVPQPLLLETEAEIDSAVAAYSNYLVRFVKGDAFGLQVSEGLRSDVMSGWRPGMPFRYYDPKKGALLAMRMDATSWGVTQTEAAFVTNGMWNGFSNGTVTIPSNVVGNSRPDMSGEKGTLEGGFTGNPSDAPPVVPPSVDDETSVDSGTYAFVVDVNMTFESDVFTYTVDGVQPPQPKEPFEANHRQTFTCYVDAIIVETGDVLAVNSDGSLPLEYLGSVVTSSATVVDANVF